MDRSTPQPGPPAHPGHVVLAVLWFLACVGLYATLLLGTGNRPLIKVQGAAATADDDADQPAMQTARVTAEPRARGARSRNLVLIASLFGAAIGFYAYQRDSRLTGPRRSPWALLLAVTCTLIAAVCVWNILFIRYILSTGFIGDVFRSFFHTARAPLFGRPQWITAWAVIPVGASIALFAIAWMLRRTARGTKARWLIVVAHVALIVAFALSDAPARLASESSSSRLAQPHDGALKGTRSILRRHVEWLATSSNKLGRLSHYPPGHLVLQHVLRSWDIQSLHKPLMIGLVALGGLAVAGIARESGGEDRGALLAQLFYATSTSILAFSTTTFDILAAPLSACCLWLMLRGVHRDEWWAGPVLGVVFTTFCLYTFASALTAALMAIAALAAVRQGAARVSRVLKTGLIAVAVTVALLILLRFSTGFDLVACLRVAMANEREHMGNSFDTSTRWILRSTGNILAFLAGSGIVMSVVALAALPVMRPIRGGPLAGVFAWSLAATILLAGVSGAFHGETERVWLPLVPALAVAAAHGLLAMNRHEPPAAQNRLIFGVLLTALAASLVQELFFRHKVRPPRRDSGESALLHNRDALLFVHAQDHAGRPDRNGAELPTRA